MARRKARLTAVQYIYAINFGNNDSPNEFMEYLDAPKKYSDKEFAKLLIDGAIEHKDQIDELISKYAVQGDDTIQAVDRAILSVGIFELLYIKETPPAIVINEYIDLAKELSKDSSKSFINAVLDKIRLDNYEK
jgi:N utilization substance protein B